MSFLRRLFGRSAPTADERMFKVTITDGAGRPIPAAKPRRAVRRVSDHPNAPFDEPPPGQRRPERHTWVIPDGTVVLARSGTWIRLSGTTKAETQADLRASPGADHLALRVVHDAGKSPGVHAFAGDRFVGAVPRRWIGEVTAIVVPWQEKSWTVLCRAAISAPEDSRADGASRSGDGLVTEVLLPVGEHVDEIYANAYDASFAFPHKQVRAPWQTTEKQAERAAWSEANKTHEREEVALSVAGVKMRCHRLPWRGQDGRDTQLLQPIDPTTSIWMPAGEVPADVASVGGRIIPVAGVTYRDGIADPSFELGRRIALRREPENPYDPNAVAVWSADGRVHAGYVPKDEAQRLARAIDAGEPRTGIVCWEAREGSRRVGLRILVGPDIEIA